jgi:hypothetical protein
MVVGVAGGVGGDCSEAMAGYAGKEGQIRNTLVHLNLDRPGDRVIM